MKDSLTVAEAVERLGRDPAEVEGLFKSLGAEAHPVVKLPSAETVLALLSAPGGRNELLERLRKRGEFIKLMESDPLRHGWEPFMWADARELLKVKSEGVLLGGNRSTKTEFAAKDVVRDLVEKPNRWWGVLHSSDVSCRLQQHPRIYKFLPPEWRDLGKQGKRINVSYTEKNGFSDNIFILPNGSRCLFFNYCQDPKVLEGYEFDGVWCDELVPPGFVEALRYRLVTRKGKLIITFTPVTGYTRTVGMYLAGAKVRRSLASPLLPGRNVADVAPGHMPYVMDCAHRDAFVMFFFTGFNLFNPYAELVKKLETATFKEKRMRAYGWVEKAVSGAFPKFRESVHVVRRNGTDDKMIRGQNDWGRGGEFLQKVTKVTTGEDDKGEATKGRDRVFLKGGLVPASPWRDVYRALPRRGTNYCVADPGITKNWVVQWYRVGDDERGKKFCYREWPDMASHGAWAEPDDKADGRAGPAQRADFGRGIVQMKRMVLEAEGWKWRKGETVRLGDLETLRLGEGDQVRARQVLPDGHQARPTGGSGWFWDGAEAEEVYERYIDPRGGGETVPSAEDGTSIIQLMEEEQFDRDGNLVGPSMVWLPAGGGRVLEGLEMVTDLLDYEPDEDVSVLNCPRLYVCEDCEQLVYALKEYTGVDGEKGALKDVIDPLRYFAKQDLDYVEPGQFTSRGGGSY